VLFTSDVKFSVRRITLAGLREASKINLKEVILCQGGNVPIVGMCLKLKKRHRRMSALLARPNASLLTIPVTLLIARMLEQTKEYEKGGWICQKRLLFM